MSCVIWCDLNELCVSCAIYSAFQTFPSPCPVQNRHVEVHKPATAFCRGSFRYKNQIWIPQTWEKYGGLMWFSCAIYSAFQTFPSLFPVQNGHVEVQKPEAAFCRGSFRYYKCKPGCPKMSKIWWFDVIWCDMKEWCASCAIYSAVREKKPECDEGVLSHLLSICDF